MPLRGRAICQRGGGRGRGEEGRCKLIASSTQSGCYPSLRAQGGGFCNTHAREKKKREPPNHQRWYAKWKLSRNMSTLHAHFCTFGTDLYAQSVMISKISASELRRKSIKSELLVGQWEIRFGSWQTTLADIIIIMMVRVTPIWVSHLPPHPQSTNHQSRRHARKIERRHQQVARSMASFFPFLRSLGWWPQKKKKRRRGCSRKGKKKFDISLSFCLLSSPSFSSPFQHV